MANAETSNITVAIPPSLLGSAPSNATTPDAELKNGYPADYFSNEEIKNGAFLLYLFGND